MNPTSGKTAHPYREGLLFLIFSVALFAHSLYSHTSGPAIGWELSPSLFPLLVSVFLFLLGLALIAENRKNPSGGGADPVNWRTVCVTAGAAVAYYLSMPYLGFVLATALFLFGMFLYLGERRPLPLILLPILFSCLVYLLFARLLYVMLPASPADVLRLALDLLIP